MMAFLSGKSFHPKNQVNQRKKWEAEEQEKQRQKTEVERHRMLQKERDREQLFKAGSSKDPKHSQVGFMYQAPPGYVEIRRKEQEAEEEAKLKEQVLYSAHPLPPHRTGCCLDTDSTDGTCARGSGS